MTLDRRTRDLLDELKHELKDVRTHSGAIAQLEDEFKQLSGDVLDVRRKLDLARQAAYDPRGRYRGIFPNEDAARGFGLFVLGHCRNLGWAREALSSDYPDVELDSKAFTSTDAAAVIPESWEATLHNMLEDFGVFERNARRRPMSGDIDNISKKTGRTSAAPLAEATAASETKPVITAIVATARKWAAYTEVPREVAEDAIVPTAEMIAEDMAEAHAEAVDEAGFVGDGTGTYNQITGVTNALIAEAVVTGSGDTWPELTLADFEQVASIPVTKAFSGNLAKWYVSHQFFWQVMVKLMLSAGGVTAAEVEGRRRPMFMGYEVEFTQKMPTATGVSQLCAVFGNLRQGATFADRRALEVQASDHFKFSSDVTAIMSTRRFDIQVIGAGAGTTPEVLAGLQTAAA